MSINAPFQWKCQPEAENIILKILERAFSCNPEIKKLDETFQKLASVRVFDLIDHLVISASKELEARMEEAGFVLHSAEPDSRIFHHPGAHLPKIGMQDHSQEVAGVALLVDSIEDFSMAYGISGKIEGAILGGFRRLHVATEQNVSLFVVERRGAWTMEPTIAHLGYLEAILQAKEIWSLRPRDLESDQQAMERTITLAETLVKNLGQDLAAWLVLDCERRYWQLRNMAGQLQKARQDRIGIGWANHDHHTFRSSRALFSRLVRLFEILGFHCRERFYAGKEAGWGAQVMENPQAKLVLFLDVDLAPEELEIDFAHQDLEPLEKLGTVGLWCGLHGDSILQAGMHHLEGQFLFDDLTEDLALQGVDMMTPFSSYSYLKQAFTKGEVWPVSSKRLEKLFQQGFINQEEKRLFQERGAIGSHLENLQRREGYKGFNQKNVSIIIRETDPRTIPAYG